MPSAKKATVPEDNFHYPLEQSDLEAEYAYVTQTMSAQEKRSELERYLKNLRDLQAACEDPAQAFHLRQATQADVDKIREAISNLILTVCRTVEKDTSLVCTQYFPTSEDITLLEKVLNKDEKLVNTVCSLFTEPNIIAFIYNTLRSLKLLNYNNRKTYRAFFAWAFDVSYYREKEHWNQYPDDETLKKEPYDFDPQNIRVFQLKVRLLTHAACSADILIREDSTFEALHYVINDLFKRDDDHLYYFECNDGFNAVRELGEYTGIERYAWNSYIGHHIARGYRTTYVFDFGAWWAHDITLKKILPLEAKIKYPKILKIDGTIPKQYGY